MSFKYYQHCCMQALGCWDLGPANILWVIVTCQALCIVPLFQPNVGAIPALTI